MKRIFILGITLLCFLGGYAEDWRTITTSKDFYYGEGSGASEEEAAKNALNGRNRYSMWSKGLRA